MESVRDSICGWELNNPDTELFDTRILEVFGHCKDCKHLKDCRVPSESIRCLVPREGKLIEIDRQDPEEGKSVTYFALVHEENIRFIQLWEQQYYWSKALCVGREDVPHQGLSALERKLGESTGGAPVAS